MKELDQVVQPQQIEDSAPVGRKKARSRLQEHFLARLGQLVEQREQQLKTGSSDKEALRLLSRALYSTYMDCVSAGIGDEANGLMQPVRLDASNEQ